MKKIFIFFVMSIICLDVWSQAKLKTQCKFGFELGFGMHYYRQSSKNLHKKCLHGWNDVTFRTLTDPQKGLSAHLTKALKYERIIGEKQKGQNGYLFRLP